jgi:hypothetical protein
MMMADVGQNLRSFNVFSAGKGRLVKAVRASMSRRRSHPAYTGKCTCAPNQID